MTKYETAGEVMDRFRRNIKPLNPTIDDVELEIDAGYIAEVNQMLAETNTVALLHNYMKPTVFFGVNGIRGDSLELSRKAAETTATRIIFCGVPFMAETAKIISPDKTVIVPTLEAGCSLADDCRAKDIREYREQFPDLPIVAYINTYADVKAEVDWCCTSGNMINVVKAAMAEMGTKSVVFLPDKYMAGNIARQLGMDLYYPKNDGQAVDYKNKSTVIGGKARCYVHELYTVDHVHQILATDPAARIIIHPEAQPQVIEEVLRHGGVSGSTSQMIKAVETLGPNERAALLTECSLGDNIIARRPDLINNLIRFCNLTCKHMKMTDAKGIYDALKENKYQIEVPDKIRVRAKRSVDRMLSVK